MSQRLSAICVAGMVAGMATGANAQTQTPPQSPPQVTPQPAPASKPQDSSTASAANPAGTVVVTGKKASSDIDRRSYDVKDNPQAQTGSAADALNTVPSVNVAPDGTVSVRGRTDVEIYVNGKPSTLLKGENRGDVLNALPGGNIEKVEVVTNPSAQFRSSGSAVLNIVTKKGKGLGGTLNLTASTGSAGRYTLSAFSGLNEGKLSLNTNLNFKHDLRKTLSQSQRLNLQSGERLNRDGIQWSTSDSAFLYSGLEYRVNDNDSFETELMVNRTTTDGRIADYSKSYDANDAVLSDYVRLSHGVWKQGWSALNFGFDHKGATDDDRFKISLDNSTWLQKRVRDHHLLPLGPGATEALERQIGKNTSNEHTLTTDFSRSVGDGRKLSLGGVIEGTKSSFDSAFVDTDPQTGLSTPRISANNHFEVEQIQSHAYLTYQANLGKWGYLVGARVEKLDLRLNQVTTGVRINDDYLRVSPSLHLSRKLSDARSLKASYSHRLKRPDNQMLNPFLNYWDPQTAGMGNPYLKPEESDKFELSYDYTSPDTNYTLELFHTRSRHQISEYSYYLNPTLLVTTQTNSGSGQSGGLDVVLSHKFAKVWDLSANATLTHAEISSADATLKRSGTTVDGKVTLNYKPNANLSYQAMYIVRGDTLTPQGNRSGNSQLNLSLRRKLSPKWSLIVTGNDVLEGARITSTTRNSRVESSSVNETQGRVFFIGLSYTPFKPAGK